MALFLSFQNREDRSWAPSKRVFHHDDWWNGWSCNKSLKFATIQHFVRAQRRGGPNPIRKEVLLPRSGNYFFLLLAPYLGKTHLQIILWRFMEEEKGRLFHGTTTMRLVVYAFMFLDLALAWFIATH
jgi:hypothetical protein